MRATLPPHCSSDWICAPESCYVRPAEPALTDRAIALAARLRCPVTVGRNVDRVGVLVQAHCLALELPGFATPLIVAPGGVEIRRRAAAGRGLHLLRACGRQPTRLRIIDATAGLGRDAFTLAWAGAAVLLIERDPLLALLLEDALSSLRVDQPQLAARLRLRSGDACQLLAREFDGQDVIYLDPMFAEPGSGLPQRDMQMLAQRHRDTDGDALLTVALALAPARIVVKRGRHQLPLLATAARPHHEIVGKRVRFDVYQSTAQRHV